MIRRPPRSTLSSSSAASDVYKRQHQHQLFRRECLIRLKKIMEGSGAAMVLSSAWRNTPAGCAEVKSVLKSYDIAPFFDKTPSFRNPYDRHLEIGQWLKQHPDVDCWVALDDLPMPQLGRNFVQTNPTTGLTESDVAKALSILNS
eukprot:TRINITY_DN39017_c0_g1_i1.p1 TRINITY_DN39017_c0_g1~~TRINITY_DN39017_c0_g1_i1.p1  ORF type:complete len:145 (+),score=38.58 TRINITY_DN39017_c0_g1_i1:126-560(+)